MKFSIFTLCFLQLLIGSMSSHTHFIQMTIVNESKRDLLITDSKLIWGKWYDCLKGQLAEISVPDVKIKSNGGTGRVCGSGTQGSWSGIEAAFKIYEVSQNRTRPNIELFHVYFDLPFGPTSNKFHVTKSGSKRADAYELLAATPNLAEVNSMPLVYLFVSNTKQEKLRWALSIIDPKANSTAYAQP